jgi:hypothetical protein
MRSYNAPKLIAQGEIADVTLGSLCVVKTDGTGDVLFQQQRSVGDPFQCPE